MNQEIKVLLWNIRSWKSKKEEFSINVQNTDIAIITETKLKTTEKIKIKGYKIVRRDRQNNINASGGVAIIVREDICMEIINMEKQEGNNMEAVGVRIILKNGKKLNIIGIYRKPGEIERKGMWRKVMSYDKKQGESIVLGDFNCHKTRWNCQTTDQNGETLNEEMDEEDMYIINEDTMSRMSERGDTPANLDLIFASRGMVDKMKYEQEEDSWGSDHFPIKASIKIGCEINNYRKRSNRLSKKTTDWEIYKTELDNLSKLIIEDTYLQLDVLEKYKYIIGYFTIAMKKANGMMVEEENIGEEEREYNTNMSERRKKEQEGEGNNTKKRTVEWWDIECKKAIEERKKKLKQSIRTKNMNDFIEYKNQRAETAKIIKDKKKKSFKNFVEGINKNTSIKYVWNKMKVLKNGFKEVEWNKWSTGDRDKEIEKEIEKLGPPWVRYNEKSKGISEQEREEEMNKKISTEELDRALRKVRGNASPGIDGIDYRMLKEMPRKIRNEMTAIFNEILERNVIPKDWRRYQFIFIDKGTKKM